MSCITPPLLIFISAAQIQDQFIFSLRENPVFETIMLMIYQTTLLGLRKLKGLTMRYRTFHGGGGFISTGTGREAVFRRPLKHVPINPTAKPLWNWLGEWTEHPSDKNWISGCLQAPNVSVTAVFLWHMLCRSKREISIASLVSLPLWKAIRMWCVLIVWKENEKHLSRQMDSAKCTYKPSNVL